MERLIKMKEYFEKIQNLSVPYKEITEYNPNGEFSGIKAITYDGADFKGEKTKVFAYLGYPDNLDEKVPAVVLVHGGGGVPFLNWVKMWNELGYAAIAMSTTGDFPLEANTGKYPEGKEHRTPWEKELHGIFSEDGYAVAPDNDSMKNSEKPLEEQWMYHALTQVVFAHNILRADEKTDKERIGITGISWGGVITSLAIGYDRRFAFAIPIYGSGYLAEAMSWQGDLFGSGKNPELWLAEKQFDKVDIPVLWLCWNEDVCFSANSNSKSYLDTIKNNPQTRLAMINNMEHSHTCGWIREESYIFADSVCKGGKRLPCFAVGSKKIKNPDNVNITGTKAYYLTEPMTYEICENNQTRQTEDWKICDVADIPENAAEYYLEITSEINGKEYITTSEIYVNN